MNIYQAGGPGRSNRSIAWGICHWNLGPQYRSVTVCDWFQGMPLTLFYYGLRNGPAAEDNVRSCNQYVAFWMSHPDKVSYMIIILTCWQKTRAQRHLHQGKQSCWAAGRGMMAHGAVAIMSSRTGTWWRPPKAIDCTHRQNAIWRSMHAFRKRTCVIVIANQLEIPLLYWLEGIPMSNAVFIISDFKRWTSFLHLWRLLLL